MAGKYQKLTDYLLTAEVDEVCLPFVRIEEILGLPLPASARGHQAWWANQPKGQALAWLQAGFRAAALSLDEERLTFSRFRDEEPNYSEQSFDENVDHLSIAEAKLRLAITLGVDPSQIEIIIRA